MPATENGRRNAQESVLDKPSLPDHDRRRDEGMRSAMPSEQEDIENLQELRDDLDQTDRLAPPDQEFEQILTSGTRSNRGVIREDPNNWLTSDRAPRDSDLDPEDRGESQPDIADGIQH